MIRFTGIRWWRQFALALGCLMLVIACNNTAPNSTDAGSNPSGAGSNPVAAGKTLKVATDPTFAPFEFQGPDGQIQGFDIDIINSIGKAEGFQVELESMRFDGMIGALQAGSVDTAMAGVTITPERAKVIDFSKPYFKAGLAIAVPEKNTDITDLDSLKNKKIAVQIGTTSADEAKKVSGAKISTFDSPDLVLQEVVNGNADAAINDKAVTLYAFKTGSLKGLKLVGEQLTAEYYGIPTPKGSENLESINRGLDTIIKDGTYAQIYKKWFDEEPPKLPETAPI
ncbi:basic amino acid ABC transporter substrate-binding protein [Microcoleus sp. FACHB-SPT15]|uniref:basic amino acid ABC transporter substrate-binding protein n=1 Tax=Microcoleus sp. FACHB-SPT15 TaxID=2692830 RepID=UPI001F55033C|nr:basic amino acid ABC transporter substrate-binding protein [Microcoleus sp. FACHB-SPT15]